VDVGRIDDVERADLPDASLAARAV
jgi:hypothetical protein